MKAGQHQLARRLALVVNGGRGSAATVALALAEAGATLALLAPESCEILTVATLSRLKGATTLGVTADLSDPASVERALEELHEQLGNIDILVHQTLDDAVISVVLPDLAAADPAGQHILLAEEDVPGLEEALHRLVGAPPPWISVIIDDGAGIAAKVMAVVFPNA